MPEPEPDFRDSLDRFESFLSELSTPEEDPDDEPVLG